MRSLTLRLVNNLYIFSKLRTQPAEYLPLYRSSHFRTAQFEDIFGEKESASRYKQLLPLNIAGATGLYPRKFLYTSLDFDPNNEVLRVVTLRGAGFHTQELSIDNVIPYSYRDMMAQAKFPEARMPVFVDDEMIYFNKAHRETLFCEQDGEWNQETVNHPKLSLSARFNEKEWMDRQGMY